MATKEEFEACKRYSGISLTSKQDHGGWLVFKSLYSQLRQNEAFKSAVIDGLTDLKDHLEAPIIVTKEDKLKQRLIDGNAK